MRAIVPVCFAILDDAFKLKTITGARVPAPGTLAMLALGLGVLTWVRRRGGIEDSAPA